MEKKYEDYYVAFIDVLGFKELLEKNAACEEICAIFQSLQENAHTGITVDGKKVDAFDQVKYYLMSDSIILYIKSEIKDAFLALVATCLKLQQKLITRAQPILLRGGIARGELYVDQNIIFGKGLSAAYQLETNVSVMPRIIFNKDLFTKGKENSDLLGGKYWDGMITRIDSDELYYVHYFALAFIGNIKDAPKIFDKVLDLCQSYLDTTYNKSLREKYLWLKNYALAECRLQKELLKSQPGGIELIRKWNIR